jgi:hypothetical protein
MIAPLSRGGDMVAPSPANGERVSRTATCLLLTAAVAIAVLSARPYAGSWNDGSRLAAVESLADHGTLVIDRSIFVEVPPRQRPDGPTPYPPDDPLLMQHGTRDRLLIRGHYYSDKPPVLTVLMAAAYKGLQMGTSLKARERPDVFCYLMTLGTSGVAYVVTIWCTFRLGALLGLSLPVRMALTASLGLATVALAYARHVNAHIVLLGVVSALLVSLVKLAEEARAGRVPWHRVLTIGGLAGLGYTIDLGMGPVILLATVALVSYRTRRFTPFALFVLGALPWVVLHHAVNYATGGTFLPANAVPEYLQAAGGGFTAQNMTGGWRHQSIGRFFVYTASLLFGKRGFFGHNLPLFLTIPAVVFLVRRRPHHLPEIVCAIAWSCGTWLVYAAGSTNSSGYAASIRWFVPLLAPAYFVIALYLRERPAYRTDFLILSGGGVVMATLMWWKGPWMQKMVPLFWPIQGAALLSWLIYRTQQKRRATDTPVCDVGEKEPAKKAA